METADMRIGITIFAIALAAGLWQRRDERAKRRLEMAAQCAWRELVAQAWRENAEFDVLAERCRQESARQSRRAGGTARVAGTLPAGLVPQPRF